MEALDADFDEGAMDRKGQRDHSHSVSSMCFSGRASLCMCISTWRGKKRTRGFLRPFPLRHVAHLVAHADRKLCFAVVQLFTSWKASTQHQLSHHIILYTLLCQEPVQDLGIGKLRLAQASMVFHSVVICVIWPQKTDTHFP